MHRLHLCCTGTLSVFNLYKWQYISYLFHTNPSYFAFVFSQKLRIIIKKKTLQWVASYCDKTRLCEVMTSIHTEPRLCVCRWRPTVQAWRKLAAWSTSLPSSQSALRMLGRDLWKSWLRWDAEIQPCCVTGCISPAFFPCAHISFPLSGRGGASCGGEGEEQGRRSLRLLLHAGLLSQTHLGHHLGWSQHPQKPLQGKQPIATRGQNGVLCSVQIRAPN